MSSKYFVRADQLPTWHRSYVNSSTTWIDLENIVQLATTNTNSSFITTNFEISSTALSLLTSPNSSTIYGIHMDNSYPNLIYKGTGLYHTFSGSFTSTIKNSNGTLSRNSLGQLCWDSTVLTNSCPYMVLVAIVGGGGGGGGASFGQHDTDGAGGGGGGTAVIALDFTKCASYTVTIGSAGTGGTISGTDGSNGGITSIKGMIGTASYSIEAEGGQGGKGNGEPNESNRAYGGYVYVNGAYIPSIESGYSSGPFNVLTIRRGGSGGLSGVNSSNKPLSVDARTGKGYSTALTYNVGLTTNTTLFAATSGGAVRSDRAFGGGGASAFSNGVGYSSSDYSGKEAPAAGSTAYGAGGVGADASSLNRATGGKGGSGAIKIWYIP